MTRNEYYERMKALYHQLQEFRYESKFHEWGFAQKSPYRWWSDEVEDFQEEFLGSLQDLGPEFVAPVLLKMLGLNYCRFKGHGNRSADSMEEVITENMEHKKVV